jgi:hypothetical protein
MSFATNGFLLLAMKSNIRVAQSAGLSSIRKWPVSFRVEPLTTL